jgi:transposase
MTRAETRNEKRKEVVEAVVIRHEPVASVARIFNIPRRTVFSWLARYRNGGWDALKEGARSRHVSWALRSTLSMRPPCEPTPTGVGPGQSRRDPGGTR